MGNEKNQRKRLGADKFKKDCPDKVVKLIKTCNRDAEITHFSSRKRKKKSVGKNEDSAGKNEDSSEQSCFVMLLTLKIKMFLLISSKHHVVPLKLASLICNTLTMCFLHH